MNGESAVIEVRNLNVYYRDFQAVRDATLAFPTHAVTALIGPSGCGKSTVLRSINRMNDLIPDARVEGEVLFHGKDIYRNGRDAVELRRRIGMVFQRPAPFAKSIYENVAWAARLNGYRGNLSELVESSLRRAGLWEEVKDKLWQTALRLSGGQQQRLCIARAIAVEPEILLMDEPAASLDPISSSRIEDLINELKESYTIIVVTHNMQQAGRISDWTAFFLTDQSRAGFLVEYASTNELFLNPKDPRTQAYISGRFG